MSSFPQCKALSPRAAVYLPPAQSPKLLVLYFMELAVHDSSRRYRVLKSLINNINNNNNNKSINEYNDKVFFLLQSPFLKWLSIHF